MTCARSTRILFPVALSALMAVCAAGCGGGRNVSTAPLPLQDREGVAAALPKGVTFETAVIPDKMYGESSKTVEQALASLLAHVKGGVLVDVGMGQEIRFESSKNKVKTSKTPAKAYMIIHIAD